MTLVSLGAIETERTLTDTGDLTALANRMRRGNYQPILVFGDMTLIDGLRRIEAAKLLGWGEIDAVVTYDIFEIRDHLQEAHRAGMPSPRRVYEFYPTLKKVLNHYLRRLKQEHQWLKRDNPAKRISSGQFYTESLNVPYGHYVIRVNWLYRAADSGDSFAKDLVLQVEAGEMQPGTAFNHMEKRTRAKNPAPPPAEQQTIIEEAVRALAMVNRALKRIEGTLKIPSGSPLIEQLRTQRTEVYSTIGRLIKEARQSNE